MGRVLRQLASSWGPALAYMALIWWLSSRRVHVNVSVPYDDKGLHFVEYGCLGLVLARATLATWPQIPLRASLAALMATISWGVLDELHQAFVPGRMPDAADLRADALGALVGVLVFSALWWKLRQRRVQSA